MYTISYYAMNKTRTVAVDHNRDAVFSLCWILEKQCIYYTVCDGVYPLDQKAFGFGDMKFWANNVSKPLWKLQDEQDKKIVPFEFEVEKSSELVFDHVLPPQKEGAWANKFIKNQTTNIEFEGSGACITSFAGKTVIIRCPFNLTDCRDDEPLPEFIKRHGGLEPTTEYLVQCYRSTAYPHHFKADKHQP